MSKLANQQIISNKLKAGLEKQASGHTHDALKIYEEILQSHPDNFHALQLSGMISAQNNDFSKAFDYLSRAVKIDDTEPNVLNNHGVVSKEMGFYEDALVSYGKAIQINPNHYEAHNNRGVVLKQLGENETAVKCYENAIVIKPDYLGAHLNQANLLQEIGRLEEALLSYEKVIQIDKNFTAAYIKCALVLQSLGRDDEALQKLQLALAIDPTLPEIQNAYGVIYRAQGDVEKALQSYRTAIELEPNYSEAYFNHGVILQEAGQYDDAIKAYDKALSIRPDYIEAYSNKSIIYRDFGDLESGLACLDKAIAINDSFPESHCNRGLILQGLKRYEEAIACYDRTLELKPDYVEAMNNRGVIFKDLGKFAEAMASFYVAISVKKDYPDAYSNLGLVFQEINQPDAAIMQYTKAIDIKADFAEAYFNRGSTFQKIQDYDSAIQDYQTAIAKKRHFAQPHNNLGVIFHELQELELSVLHFDQAMEDVSTLPDASWNRSLVLLTQGKYLEGWKEYEWRRKASKSGVLKNRIFHKPLWLGKESIENKTILVVSEQGLGDTLQFCRYVSILAKLGVKVIFEVQKPLVNLMKGLEGVFGMTTTGIEPAEPYDYYCPLMSLPHVFKTTLETIPSPASYIPLDPVKTEYWAKKLGKKDKMRIGLVWSGGFRPDQPEVWATNTRRNLPLENLIAFKGIDAEFYSLQKGDPAESELIEIQKNGWDGPNIINYASELTDFTDTAALIENLDLVIAVDTSTAHLAAALGKPTWILNRFDTCWRWLKEREDSPWYKSVRLFRQKEQGDWSTVIEKITSELKKNSSQTHKKSIKSNQKVTAVIIDTYYDRKTLQHAIKKVECLPFVDEIVFVSDRKLINMQECSFIEIKPIKSNNEYGSIIFNQLINLTRNNHLLIFQWDGFPINPLKWDDEFLRCDYIGAPNSYNNEVVGNGGFSLRSRKLIESLHKLNIDIDLNKQEDQPEDTIICITRKQDLESLGVKFGPIDLAKKFSYESGTLLNTFGFHGPHNLPIFVEEDFLIECSDEIIQRVGQPHALINVLIKSIEYKKMDFVRSVIYDYEKKPNLVRAFNLLNAHYPQHALLKLFQI